MEDIFDRYTKLFTPGEDGEASWYSEDGWDLEALRREVTVTGLFSADVGILLDVMKANVRWHEDIYKAQSIEGDYENMAVAFRKSITDTAISRPEGGAERVTKVFNRYPWDEDARTYRGPDGQPLSREERDRLVGIELEYPVTLSLNLSEFQFLVGALGPDEVCEGARALTFWSPENEEHAARLLALIESQESRFREAGCLSIYEFVC